MSKTKFILTGALLALAAFVLVLAPTSALAAKKNMVKIKGYFTAVTPDGAGGGTVTIHDIASDTDVTVNVVGSTKIHKNNEEGAAIEDLVPGDKAKAKYNADTDANDAKRIHAKSPKAHGVITEVGPDSVTIENAHGVQVQVFVTLDTKIKAND